MRKLGLKITILIVALIVAVSHAFYVQFIYDSVSVGGYFLVATILFAAGGFASLSSGRLFKPAAVGLFILSLIDNVLIVLTRTVPTPLVGGAVFDWSMDWIPPGAVQVFIAQVILMILTGYIFMSKKKAA